MSTSTKQPPFRPGDRVRFIYDQDHIEIVESCDLVAEGEIHWRVMTIWDSSRRIADAVEFVLVDAAPLPPRRVLRCVAAFAIGLAVGGSAPAQAAEYKPIDLDQYVLMVTPNNAGRKIEVTYPMKVFEGEDYGVIYIPGYIGADSLRNTVFVKVEFNKLTSEQIGYLRENCLDYQPCIARWDITLLRHENKLPTGYEFRGGLLPVGTEVVQLDGWRR